MLNGQLLRNGLINGTNTIRQSGTQLILSLMISIGFYKIKRVVSHALRHEPRSYNLNLDKQGWVLLSDLVLALNLKGVRVDENSIAKMVEFFRKKRHQILNGKIRAYYGHSLENKILKNQLSHLNFYITCNNSK